MQSDSQSIRNIRNGITTLAKLRSPNHATDHIEAELEKIATKETYHIEFDNLFVFFITNNKVSDLITTHFPEYIKQEQVLIVVVGKINTTSVHDKILKAAVKEAWNKGDVDVSKRTYHITRVLNLYMNPMDHVDVPKHEIMTDDEVQVIVERGIVPTTLPKIRVNDPPVMWIGGRVGQVVKVHRPLEIAYRYIVD